jgi:ubiquinone/menaquinone biosynthesis C-methylase UbiE
MRSWKSLRSHQRDWEDLGRVDPLWAILTSAERRFGKWDRSEFFASGRTEASRLLLKAEELGLPERRRSALDFGCGVGRVTRALAEYFESCVGVDISEPMILQAREWHADCRNCEFVLNTEGDLRGFQNGSFDLVYCNIVLQHLPSRNLIASYISEFIRILARGGLLVFQLPHHLAWRNRIQPRRRAYHLLRALGASERYLLNSLKLSPMRMNFVPEPEVIRWVQAAGGRVVSVDRMTDVYRLYYVA